MLFMRICWQGGFLALCWNSENLKLFGFMDVDSVGFFEV